ncbi:MAG: ABC transporter permease [Ruminiclostridium sp.]|jgi:D-methionine transport system permease protein|nr:ABC transporter permease [Ruminiclostridium sp.]
MLESLAAFWGQYGSLLIEGTGDTLIMTSLSTIFAYVLGVPIGVLLVISQPHGIRPNRGIANVLGWIVNIGRSIPFIILMILLLEFTKLIMGTKLGIRGATLPLVISAAPFVARMVETSLSEVDAGVIEAAQSMGASTWQIIQKVYLPEAKPSLILGGSISTITILAYTAMAGAIGAGGLGDLAIRYGYVRNIPSMTWATVILIIILVQIIQSVFSLLAKTTDKRLR